MTRHSQHKHLSLTFGKVILVLARCCKSKSPVSSSKIKTEKARCSTPRGVAATNSCEPRLDSDPMTLSSLSNTSTVSFSIMSVCVMAVPFHVEVAMVEYALVFVVYSCVVARILAARYCRAAASQCWPKMLTSSLVGGEAAGFFARFFPAKI